MVAVLGPTIKRGKSEQVVATPWEFIYAVELKFGMLGVDLAATDDNHKAPVWITPERDTFTVDWTYILSGGLGWLNPEFDPMEKWVAKCALEQQRGAEFLVLTPASVGANWFWDYVRPFATSYSIGRMKFIGHKDQYPKDLLLNHYHSDPNPLLQRWRWRDERDRGTVKT